MHYCCWRDNCASFAFVQRGNASSNFRFPAEFDYTKLGNYTSLHTHSRDDEEKHIWGCLGTNVPPDEQDKLRQELKEEHDEHKKHGELFTAPTGHCYTYELDKGKGESLVMDWAASKAYNHAEMLAEYRELAVNETVPNRWPDGVITGAKTPAQVGDHRINKNLLPVFVQANKLRYRIIGALLVTASGASLVLLVAYSIWLRCVMGCLELRLMPGERPRAQRCLGHVIIQLFVVGMVFVPYLTWAALSYYGRFHALWIAVALCAGFALFCTVMFTRLIWNHLNNYNDAFRQRRVFRITLLVPFYALDAAYALKCAVGVGGKIKMNDTPIVFAHAFRELYEAYTVFNFIMFLLESVEKLAVTDKALSHNQVVHGEFSLHGEKIDAQAYFDEEAVVQLLEEDAKAMEAAGHPSHGGCPFPWNYCCEPWKGKDFIRNNVWWVLQYVVVQILLTVTTVYLQLTGNFDEDTPHWDKGWIYCILVKVFSQYGCINSLVYLYHGLSHVLKDLQPLGKFASIKLVVFFTFWQHLIFNILKRAAPDWLPWKEYWNVWGDGSYESGMHVSVWILQHSMICFEMVVASWFHRAVFSHTDFEPKYGEKTKKYSKRGALRHMLGCADFKSDLRHFVMNAKRDVQEFGLGTISPLTSQHKRNTDGSSQNSDPGQVSFLRHVNSQLMDPYSSSSSYDSSSSSPPPVSSPNKRRATRISLQPPQLSPEPESSMLDYERPRPSHPQA